MVIHVFCVNPALLELTFDISVAKRHDYYYFFIGKFNAKIVYWYIPALSNRNRNNNKFTILSTASSSWLDTNFQLHMNVDLSLCNTIILQ